MRSVTILGVNFRSGTPAAVVEQSLRGGLVVVPSAPVLVDMADKPALREAVLGADLAITDSGLMVLMWRLLTGEKLERVSGLEYLKLLLEELQKAESGKLKAEDSDLIPSENPQVSLPALGPATAGGLLPHSPTGHPIQSASGHSLAVPSTPHGSVKSQVSHAATGGVFWIMPTAAARDRNLAWLRSQGFTTTVDDCYIAPVYPPDGPLSDGDLLTAVQRRHPSHIIIALGGGVQERLGFTLRQSLAKPESGQRLGADGEAKRKAEGSDPSAESPSSAFSFQPSAFGSAYRPGIHCIGAAIGFLSGEQVRIPMWVDYFYLGWLWRSLSAPTRFAPRYWKAKRLIGLMIRYRGKSPGG